MAENGSGDLTDKLTKSYSKLLKILEKAKELLIVLHNNPDPDALASGYALAYLAETLFGINVSIAYGGSIGRRENQTMVSLLDIRLKQINRIKFAKYDCKALVDTQPCAGNNAFPENIRPNIVIDHHPKRRDSKADLLTIHPDVGATATILTLWLKEAKLTVPTDLATALSYALISETQNMNREACSLDIQTYLEIYPQSNLRKLARIIHPPLPHDYYVYFVNALNKAVTYRNLIVSHMGEVSSPEFVAEMADFLIRHRYVSWSLCTGVQDDLLYISIRSSRNDAEAHKIIKTLVSNKNNVGGHNQMAGGFIPLTAEMKKNLPDLYETITRKFSVETGNAKNGQSVEYKLLL